MKSYWKLGNSQLRWGFITKTVKECKPKYQSTTAHKPKESTRRYFFEIDGQEVMVCKTFYLDTINVSQSTIDTALAKVNNVGVVESSQHLLRKRQPASKLESEVDEIKKHIQSFPVVESHYCRKKTTKKY